MTFVAPRIGNDVSYVTRIKPASHSVWQAQYLVKVNPDKGFSDITLRFGHFSGLTLF